MANNIRKYLEYSFFIVLNIILIAPIYSKLYLLVAIISYYIAADILRVSEDIILYDDPSFFILFCCFSLSLTIIKLIVFQIIYVFENKLPYIHNFFDNYRTNKYFLLKTLFSALIIDIIFTFITKNIFSLFFGLLFSYLTFLIFFHFNKKGRPFNDNINKIIIIIFIGIILFIFMCPLLLFIIYYLLDIIGKAIGLY